MDSLAVLVAILAWLLVLGVALFRTPGSGLRAQAGTWLVLTVLSMGIVFIVAFIVVYALLFTFGSGAAGAGAVVAAIALAATPVAWALVLRRRARRSPTSHG